MTRELEINIEPIVKWLREEKNEKMNCLFERRGIQFKIIWSNVCFSNKNGRHFVGQTWRAVFGYSLAYHICCVVVHGCAWSSCYLMIDLDIIHVDQTSTSKRVQCSIVTSADCIIQTGACSMSCGRRTILLRRC